MTAANPASDPALAAGIDRAMAHAPRGDADAWSGLADEPAAAELVRARIRFHGVAAILAERPQALAAAPAQVRDIISGEASLRRIWEETHRTALVAALEQMDRRGVCPLIMKGTMLAYALYPDPAMRQRGDSDLLVLPEELDASRAALAAAGFARVPLAVPSRFQEIWRTGGTFGMTHDVDLHWQTHPARTMQAVLVEEEFTANPVALPRLWSGARGINRVSTFLHCAINQAAHMIVGTVLDGRVVPGEPKLGWLYDIHLLASAFTADEWNRLVAMGRDRQVAPTMLVTLRQSANAFGTAIPAEVEGDLASLVQDCMVASYIGQASSSDILRQAVAAAPGWHGKLTELAFHLFPDRARLRQLHPEYPEWPLPLLHARRLLAHMWRQLSAGPQRG